jgi:hypothetical protein
MALFPVACSHSDSFSTPVSTVGPSGTGSDVQLTFNPDQDYWPIWTQDGQGILYAFVDPQFPNHRCLGLLPAASGTRLWQLCDNRSFRADTVSSFAAYALDGAGRLLFAEAVSPARPGGGTPPSVTLWLADTASPYQRTPLLTFPTTVGSTVVTWLSDIVWTGSNAFMALGQQFNLLPHCVTAGKPLNTSTVCSTYDTTFAGAGMVLSGTITGTHATLHAVTGTDSATGYTLAENGTSIVFTRHHDLRLFRIPIGGGASAPLPIQWDYPQTDIPVTGELAGVSCKASVCIVAHDGIFLSDAYSNADCNGGVCQEFAHFFFQVDTLHPQSAPAAFMELHRVSLSSGADEVLRSNTTNTIFATPQISPVSGDVAVQVGGGWGHLQTFATRGLPDLFTVDGNSVLHLYKGLVP